jgi:hypothetical protein
MRLICFGMLTVALVAPARVEAQQRLRLSFDATLGFGTGSGGGPWNHDDGFALDGLLGARVGGARKVAVLAAVDGGMHAIMGGDDCLLSPSGGCVPDFPILYYGAVLIGVEATAPRRLSLRLLAGPAYFHGDEGGTALGVQGRVDVATPPLAHVAIAASIRGAVMPDFQGDALRVRAFGLGLRLQ